LRKNTSGSTKRIPSSKLSKRNAKDDMSGISLHSMR